MWEGTLTPISQAYKIWIRYFPTKDLAEVTINHPYVTVKVIDPLVAPDPRGTGEPTPHVYRYRHPPHLPALCAWDPGDDPWDPSEYIGDKIIAWTIRWLLFYEDWLDSGIWRGGGRHPDPDARHFATESAPKPTASLANPELFSKVGRRFGMFTSSFAIGRAHYGAFASGMALIDRLLRR
ncbi:hypothetical protein ACCT20_03375 [Rhizobium ruizarguesonis]|uniref:hypothetical protein n=1 Tax=Rhizobium TaxID=379 RepID=UPI0010310882|nr:hypothetical protein [Rhizobium ruizarguesonis]TBA37493.1 hypothetical protein ELH60_08585 [Rhizobium ruizarguesonis]TBC62839.1 hypothetical protein ELH36_08590 [Rhizobium ruizarguesonis]TBD37482.1 hypothetical protein ELH18_08415 [Rhizobium ruizarguesonis]